MSDQQGDVVLYQTLEGGDISIADGVVEMSGGLETAVYLSLFGGNERDAGNAESRAAWWGNLNEVPERQYRSETQNLLQSLPVTSYNLRRIEDAARRDLEWMREVGAASAISVSASVPGLNRVRLVIDIGAIDLEAESSVIEYEETWRASV
jgi:phage gp46-like protein